MVSAETLFPNTVSCPGTWVRSDIAFWGTQCAYLLSLSRPGHWNLPLCPQELHAIGHLPFLLSLPQLPLPGPFWCHQNVPVVFPSSIAFYSRTPSPRVSAISPVSFPCHFSPCSCPSGFCPCTPGTPLSARVTAAFPAALASVDLSLAAAVLSLGF